MILRFVYHHICQYGINYTTLFWRTRQQNTAFIVLDAAYLPVFRELTTNFMHKAIPMMKRKLIPFTLFAALYASTTFYSSFSQEISKSIYNL